MGYYKVTGKIIIYKIKKKLYKNYDKSGNLELLQIDFRNINKTLLNKLANLLSLELLKL